MQLLHGHGLFKRRFNAYPSDKVVADLTELVPRFRIDEVALLDSNFLVDIKRAIQIAHRIADSKVKFRRTFQAPPTFSGR